MLEIKSNKRHLTDGMEQPNQDKIRTLDEKETYKYWGVLKADTIKLVEMKEKKRKNISGEPKGTRDKTMKQKPYRRNKYQG